eukprot:726669-Amphidinium_carterae.2
MPLYGQDALPQLRGGGGRSTGKGQSKGEPTDAKSQRIRKVVRVGKAHGFLLSTQQAQALLAIERMGQKVDKLNGQELFHELRRQASLLGMTVPQGHSAGSKTQPAGGGDGWSEVTRGRKPTQADPDATAKPNPKGGQKHPPRATRPT